MLRIILSDHNNLTNKGVSDNIASIISIGYVRIIDNDKFASKNINNLSITTNFAKSKKLNLTKSKKSNFAKTNFSKTDFLTSKTKKTFIYLQKIFIKVLILYHFELKYYI